MDELSRRGFVKLLGGALTVPTLGALGLKAESPIVVAHTLEDVRAEVEPLQFTDLTLLRMVQAGGEGPTLVRLDGVTVNNIAMSRWIAAPEHEIYIVEGQPVTFTLELRGGVLATSIRRGVLR